MHPNALNMRAPCKRQCLCHQPAAMPAASQFGDKPQISNFAVSAFAEIKLKHPNLNPGRINDGIDFDLGITNDALKRIISHDEP